MARLPVLHKRRRSKGQRALDLAKGAATVWTTVKASSAGARAAKRGAKAYGAAKGAKIAGARRGELRLELVLADARGLAQRGDDLEHRGLHPGADVVGPVRLGVRGRREVGRDDVADIGVVARLAPVAEDPRPLARQQLAA